MTYQLRSLLDDNPLAQVSIYLHLQIDTLFKTAQEIEYLLDQAIEGEAISGNEFERAYGLFWLWVLGAFELTRTLHTAKESIKEGKRKEFEAFKGRLIRLRAPMAKHQLAGRKQPIHSELSVAGFDRATRDFHFLIEGEKHCARKTIHEFKALVRSVKQEDVLVEVEIS